jgi:hypothetical protein
MSTTVWVTRVTIGTEVPHVTRYEASEVRTLTFTVDNGANRPKQVVRRSTGMKFFTDFDAMLDYCKTYVRGRVEHHTRVAANLQKQLLSLSTELPIHPHGSAMHRDRPERPACSTP